MSKVRGTHHSMFELKEGVRGWFRVSNEGVVASIWVEQPDGSRRLFIPYKEGSE
jgi:cell envelope opacity-associated protein A